MMMAAQIKTRMASAPAQVKVLFFLVDNGRGIKSNWIGICLPPTKYKAVGGKGGSVAMGQKVQDSKGCC